MKHKLIPYEELPTVLSAIRKQPDVKLVLTNGCFDLLHPGHIFALTYARTLGDILLVLINTDDYVQQMKGPERPYFDLKNRLFMVGSLEPVSIVTPLRDSNVVEALQFIKPDIWAKGQDYTLETLNQDERKVAEALGIKIEFTPIMPDVSTTNIVETIRSNAITRYEQEQGLFSQDGDNISSDEIAYGLPEDVDKHFKRIVAGNIQGSSKTYEKNFAGDILDMPDIQCVYRKEETIINRHCGCKKKRLFCNHFNKPINIRECMVCKERKAE
jgi:rfaE bifunctional protein nucleotidyltransferase chain/domain